MTEIPLIGFGPKPPSQKGGAPKNKPNPQKQSQGNRDNNNRNDNRKGNAKRHRQRHKKNYALHYIFLTLVFAATLVVLSLTVLFKIEDIQINGADLVNKAVVVELSGVKIGDNLIKIDKKKMEKNIIKQEYLIDSITVKRKFPSTLVINLEMSDAEMCIKQGGEFYFFNNTLRLIERSKTNTHPKITMFRGVTVGAKKIADPKSSGVSSEPVNAEDYKENEMGDFVEMKLGDYLVENDENGLAMCLRIRDALKKTKIPSITSVDMRDPVSVDFFFEDRIMIKVGTVTDLEAKLSSAYRVIENELIDNEEGVLDVQIAKKAYFRAIDIELP